jgi:hypothetical protein
MAKTTVAPRPQPKTTARTASVTAKPSLERSKSGRKPAIDPVKQFQMPFEKENIVWIIAGVATITLGYVIMRFSDPMGFMALSVAPIILLLGYCVVLPWGIMHGARQYAKAKRQAVVTDMPTSDSPISVG